MDRKKPGKPEGRPVRAPSHAGRRSGVTKSRQLVVLRGRLWVSPDGDAHALQCVARTRKGSRCRNPVEYGQLLGLHEFRLGPAGYVQAYRSDVAYDGEPAVRAEEAGTTGAQDTPTGSVAAVFEAASQLRPRPGYVNGLDHDEWYVEATPDLLRALAQLSRAHYERELADWLGQLSEPLCMEPLDAVLSYDTCPKTWCCRSVQAAGLPCEPRVLARAADLGRCTYTHPGHTRICRTAPLEGSDRCEGHAA